MSIAAMASPQYIDVRLLFMLVGFSGVDLVVLEGSQVSNDVFQLTFYFCPCHGANAFGRAVSAGQKPAG
jgi:hypothetical protein